MILPISQILQSRQTRSEHGFQVLPIRSRHGEIKLQILFDLLRSENLGQPQLTHDERNVEKIAHQFCHTLLGLRHFSNINTEMMQMFREMRIDSRIVTWVAVHI